MKRIYFIAALISLLVLFGCAAEAPVYAPVDNTTVPAASSPSAFVPRITIDELLQKINSHADILIVDSRVDVEEQFSSGHIPGAIAMPLSKVIEGQWLPPVDKEIIFYCS